MAWGWRLRVVVLGAETAEKIKKKKKKKSNSNIIPSIISSNWTNLNDVKLLKHVT